MDEKTFDSGTPVGSGEGGGSTFARAKDFVGEKYGAASDAVKNKYTAVREKVDEVDFSEMTDKVKNYVRSNPGKAMLISVGVGFVIGLLLRRDSDD